MRYFMRLAFNGTPFFGWQMQPKAVSVQEVLEKSLSLMLFGGNGDAPRQRLAITGCGRTDTGVHARDFMAHFDFAPEDASDNDISAGNLEKRMENPLQSTGSRRIFIQKLNSFLPKEIVVYDIFPVADDAHARFDAIDRTYRYYVDIQKDAFNFPYAYRVFVPLDVEKMNEAAEILLHNDDFTSFSKVHTQVNNMRCKVTYAKWEMKNGQLVFTITANRFLRNMVRAIVGTLLQVGRGRLTIEEFRTIILQKDRCKAGDSVPAHALFLEKVNYPERLRN